MVTVVAGWLSLEFILLLIVGILFTSKIIGMEAYYEGQGSHAWSFLGRGVRNSELQRPGKPAYFLDNCCPIEFCSMMGMFFNLHYLVCIH